MIRDDTGKSVFEKTNCSRILNCVNQELLFPAVMTLRANIYEHFPFKDVKGGWNVIIYFGADTMRYLSFDLLYFYFFILLLFYFFIFHFEIILYLLIYDILVSVT